MASSSSQQFFIALLPPQEIQDYVDGVKRVFADRFNSRAALKSPPHITLQPPFEWSTENCSALNQSLSEFATQHAPIPVTLQGFGAFAPRVIFVDVVKTPELLAVQSALTAYMENTLGVVDPSSALRSKTRSFAPHMTVGFRDLTKSNFHAAWAEFQHQPIEFAFTTSHLTLLMHDGKRWNVCCEFPFQASIQMGN